MPDRAAVICGIDRLRQPAPGYQPAVLRLSGGQTLYVLMNHAVYSVDLTGKEYMVVADEV